MYEFIIRKTIKDCNKTKSYEVRMAYGKLSGISGIISNAVLVTIKILVGLFSGSLAIIADAMNNLMDATSALITLIAFRLASTPSDERHPFGHQRSEQIAGVIISILMIVVGIQVLISSIKEFITPRELVFNKTVIIMLIVAVAIKLWQALFNYKIGKKINSATVLAAATDGRNDVVITASVLASVLIQSYVKIEAVNLDALLGTGISILIIKSGIEFMLKTASPLIGEAPDPVLVDEIRECILSHSNALGMHDLELHTYGEGQIYGSVHIEVDAHAEFLAVHDLIDHIEQDLHKRCNINITVHPDPVHKTTFS